MNRYYLEYYYDNDNKLICVIHDDGNLRRVTKEKNLQEIKNLIYKHHSKMNEDGTVTYRARRIIEDYKKYQSKRKRKLLLYNLPKVPLVLARAYPKATAIILSISIAGSIGAGALNNNSNEDITSPPAITYEIEDLDDSYALKQEDVTYKEKEINSMMKENINTFHFSYEDRSHSDNITNAKRYEDLFNEYGNRYGIDPNLLMALASQESGGEHYNNLDNGPAEGIMQIEKSVHIGTTVKAYNVQTHEYESIEVTEDNLQDLETNIQVGTMILQNCLKEKNYNIPLALQTYNFGPGNMSKVLHTCSDLEEISVESMIDDPTNDEWMNYRSFIGVGDPQYVEHVFSYLDQDQKLTITTDNHYINLNIHNDLEKQKEV